MIERIIIAGAGGQGIMLMGKIIALAGLKENKQVSWIPSYGAEVRGGAAYCMVVISDKEISSPFVNQADTLIVMNQPSWDKFKEKIGPGGVMIINSSLVERAKKKRNKLKISAAPFTDIASGLGNIKVANMVAVGLYLKTKKILSLQSALKVIEEAAPAGRTDLININQKAIYAGLGTIKKERKDEQD